MSPGSTLPPKKLNPPRNPGKELEEVDIVFKALAHPARRHMLLVLHFRGGEMSSRDIARRFACTWPTTTRHLGVLRQAGLVRVFRRGRERFYALASERLLKIVGDWINWFSEKPLVNPG